jgi:glucose-1-phosphate adenylyltransferase
VERSVLSPGVTVEKGAVVRNAIVLSDTMIKAGAEVQYAIIDRHVVIGGGAVIGEPLDLDDPSSEDLVLIGQYARIHENRRLGKGERVPGVDPL